MNWSEVGSTIAKYAPALGAAIGGPVGGIAGTAISTVAKLFGVEETPDAVMQAIQADPNAMVKLRQAEMQHEATMAQMKVDLSITKEQEDTKRFEAASQADISGQTTRPKIALIMAYALAIPYYGIGAAIVYAIVTGMADLVNMWPSLFAYLSIPMGLLRWYMGDLRKEHAQDRGIVPALNPLGAIFGVKK